MYRLNEEQQRIVGQVAAVADQSIAPHAARVDRERAFPRNPSAGLAEAGLLGLTVPAELRRPGSGPRDDGGGARRSRAAMLVDRDGVPDAPVRRRVLRRGVREDALPTCRRPRAASTSARSRSASAARAAISGRRSAGRAVERRREAQRTEIVRDVGRSGRRLCRVDAGRQRERSRSRARSTSCSATIQASPCPAPGTASACAATPARR